MFENIFSIALILQIFALLNPPSSFPVLLAAHKQRMNIRLIAVKATLVAYAVALGVIFFGPLLFTIYGVSIDAFRIAGGIILLLLGIENARSKKDVKEVELDGLISIIATPLLTGPSTISFLTIKAFELGQVDLLVNTTFAFMIVGVVFFIFAVLLPKINPKVIEIVAKILGLFLMAIGIEMIAKGASVILFAKSVA